MKPYYQHQGITIYHGDCREILPEIERVDLVLTDPPYGIGADQNKRANTQYGNAIAQSKDYGEGNWDFEPPSKDVMDLILKSGASQIVWGGNFFEFPASSCWLVWDKDNGNNEYADCELAYTNLKKAVRKIKYRWMGMLQEQMGSLKEERFHPTQKPVAVMKWCILQAPETVQTILDPFMGSGTTLRAAKDLNRQAIGIELEEKYCEIAAKRLSQEVFNFLPTQ